jgi:hypothetical protein
MNARSLPHHRFVLLGALAGVTAAAFACGACGGGEAQSGVAKAKLPSGTRTEAVEHESCEDAGHRVELLDATGDGKPDIKRVYDTKTNKEICRISDLNHDGKPDMYEYYDANGQLRRREGVFDDTGVVNLIEYYEGGKLVRKELDTTGQHRIDTWDTYDPATGKRVKRERDSTNDGRVDQWWTWEGDKVSIAIDKDGDGQPDPEATVVIGGSGGAGPDKDGGLAAIDAGPSALAAKAPESPIAPAALSKPDSPTGSTLPDAGPPTRKKK